MNRFVYTMLSALAGAGLVLLTGASAPSAPNPQSAIRNPPFDGWRVVGVVVEDAAGQRFTLPLAGVDAPVPTATPPPTNTPRPAPTVTASATPTPTDTPAPDTPTPTQEVTALPPPTPRPTSEPKACLVKLSVGWAVRERTRPSISAPTTPTSPIPAGSLLAVDEFAEADGYLWAHVATGWFAARAGADWWIAPVSGYEEICAEVPGLPLGTTLPPALVAMPGVWVGPGANRDELVQFGERIQATGQVPAAVVYGEPDAASLLVRRGWFVLLRAAGVPDCPTLRGAPDESARQFVQQALSALQGVPRHAVVLANECTWPSASWAAAWIVAAADAAAEAGVRALVPVVWSPGTPMLEWVPTLAEAYADAEIVLLWGINVYPARAGVPLAQRDGYTQYTTWRHELYAQYLRGVPVVITEYARGDGSEQPDWSDISAWWQQVRDRVVMATAWYVAGSGGLGHWPAANLAGQLTRLAEALVRR